MLILGAGHHRLHLLEVPDVYGMGKTYTRGAASITAELQDIYDEASGWAETITLRQLIVLDETQLLKSKNLVPCLNELGKRGRRLDRPRRPRPHQRPR